MNGTNRIMLGASLFSLFAAHMAGATNWIQDAPLGAKWSESTSWSNFPLPLPGSGQSAIFAVTQANSYNVNVDVAAETRLQQVQSGPYVFNGNGLIHIAPASNTQWQNVMYNLGPAGTVVTYNVPVGFNSPTAGNYVQAQQGSTNNITKFNNGFKVENAAGNGLNLHVGIYEINGDFTVAGSTTARLRLDAGTVVKIGGTGTTSIGGPGYIQTSGGELQLNRTGAFTVVDPVMGSLRVEQTKVVFGAENATGAGTNVKLYQSVDTGMLVSGGNYNQNFGYLAALGSSTATDIDMANSACIWTFADSSAISWNNLTISNVDTDKTIIRFALGTGGGLTAAQIGKITLNGTVLTTGDTTVEDGYLYITAPIQKSGITTWNANVAAGAKWSNGANWSTGVPALSDIALFQNAQANTLTVDVDVAGTTRLQQVSQTHVFNGVGSVNVAASPAAQFEACIYNTTAGAVTYNVPVSFNISSASGYYGQMNNNNGGTTVFNGPFSFESGMINAKGGTHQFNGDLNIAGTLRIDAATSVVIGGTGTTVIAAEYILTSGAGALYLNRTGAYTLVNPFVGYLRDENCKIYFGADRAVADGTDVTLYRTGTNSALVSAGDYTQNFGTLSVASVRGGLIDMQKSAAVWTFEDCSGVSWLGDLAITNVDVEKTVIRFEGLTDAQVGQIVLDGTRLNSSSVSRSGDYIYIAQARPVPVAMPLFALVGKSDNLTLPSIFSDHMILQRERPVPVWGTASPSASVSVEFSGQIKSTLAGADGKWRVDLDPLLASSTPAVLTIRSGRSAICFTDVLVGEVWLCSGQSNMEWKMECRTRFDWAEAAIKEADYPEIRLFFTPARYTADLKETTESRWTVCSPASVRLFSAVAYHFGRKLHQDLNVPVGLLQSALGATPIEAWTPAEGFQGIESLSSIYNTAQNLDNVSSISRITPSALYNGMIHPHVPFVIRGTIWYQGEANFRDGMLYVDKTRALLNGWRNRWGYDFPFYFVQIAPFRYPGVEPDVLPEFWEAQAEIVKTISGTGMAVVSDTATLDDIHPPHKEATGIRLALLAEAGTYGMNVVSTGPVFQSLEKSGNILQVVFDSADGLTTRDGNDPDWFEVAGADGVFKTAEAQINGNTVSVQSIEVTEPVSVRFAWDQLAIPNLVNGAELPTGAFRADVSGQP